MRLDSMPRKLFLAAISECQGRRQDVQNGDGHKKLPAEVHELVIAEARKRTAHPDIEEKKRENLNHKPEDRQKRTDYRTVQGRDIVEHMAERGRSATEEEQCGDACD